MRLRSALALASVMLSGCVDEADDTGRSDRPGRHGTRIATDLPAGLPSADAARPLRHLQLVPPLGHRPVESRRVTSFAAGENTNHFDATIVSYVPRGWRVASTADLAPPGTTATPATPVAPRMLDGLPPDLVLASGRRLVVVTVCSDMQPASAPQPGLDDPTGDQAARAAAGRYYRGPPFGSTADREPPRLAPHVYRAAHMIAMGFPGGGCLMFGDATVPDPMVADPSSGGSPEEIQKAIAAARRRPLAAHFVGIAKRTTAYWGRSARLPSSSLRAEAIARRAQRAVMAAPRLRYEEQLAYCRDGSNCAETEAGSTRIVDRERESAYIFADVTNHGPGSRALIVRTGSGVLRSGGGQCWSPDSYGGSFSGGFLFSGSFSHEDDRAAFFPPLQRWQLSYDPPRAAGPGRTELHWHSYFDRGTAIVDNATLRLVRMKRILRATIRVWRPQRVSFSYPSSLERVRPEPRCRDENP